MPRTPPPTPFGSILDVPGIEVGHHQRRGRGWETGTTVLSAPHGATPGVDVRGGGPGTRETDALEPHNLVDTIHAICLTGGSAYGLSAADGVMEVLESRQLGVPVTGGVVPVVPTAVIFDLGRGGVFGNRPDASFGARATRNASPTAHRWGSVGAGTGARAAVLQGGIGTASAVVDTPTGAHLTVGAVAVVNAHGSVVDPATGRLWEAPARTRPRGPELRALRNALETPADAARGRRLNTTIGVVATDAAMTKAEAGKLASVAHNGLARAVRPSHSLFDGDTVFALATGEQQITADATRFEVPATYPGALNALFAAAADVFALACTHAILSATSLGAAAYADLCPTVAAANGVPPPTHR
ncbi:MAG: P1 family peptidase [Ilumatobacteraceae bacterium]|nr:P1 family peptidase [Ilumatobacteraceae bacterium]